MSTTVSYADKKTGATKTITGATSLQPTDSGKTCFLDGTVGAAVGLPALDYGLNFRVQVASTFITSNWVLSSSEGDNISGIISDMGSTPAVVVADAEDQINFVASAETVGDFIDIQSDMENSQWIVTGLCGANGGITATDPA